MKPQASLCAAGGTGTGSIVLLLNRLTLAPTTVKISLNRGFDRRSH